MHTIDVGSVRSVSIGGWTITLPRDLEERILQNEGSQIAGGNRRRAVWPCRSREVAHRSRRSLAARLPTAAEAKPSSSEAQRDLRRDVEKAIARTLEQVRYVGEWHSHPRRARTKPSPTDLCQLGWLASTLSMDGCPGLMLIAGDKRVSVNLGEIDRAGRGRAS